MCRIAVLLTVFNRKDKTLKCLKLLSSQERNFHFFSLDVYLTNDGCTDGTPEAVKRCYPFVRIINGDGNLYWNHGMLEAWKAASKDDYDFYLWINDDVELYPNAVERLLDESKIHNHEAIIGGAMCASFDNTLVTYGGRISRHRLIQDVQRAQKCNTLSGNLVLVPKYVYQKIGMNDPYYKHSLGDLDYTLTANENGLQVWVARGIFGICDREDRIQGWSDRRNNLLTRFKNLYSIRGNNPIMEFHFNLKHYGIINAVYRFILSHLHTLLPQIWNH